MPAAKDSVYVAQLQYIDCPIFSRNEVIHSLFNLIRQCQINLPTLQYSFCVVANHGVHLYITQLVTQWYWVMSCSTRQVIIGLLPIQTKKVSALAQHRKCMKMHEHALQHKAHIGSLHSSWSSLICWSSSGIPVSVQTSETPLGGGNFTTRLNLSMWNKSIVLAAMAWCLMIRVPVFCFARLCYVYTCIYN